MRRIKMFTMAPTIIIALLLVAIPLTACKTGTKYVDVGEPVLLKIVGDYEGLDEKATFDLVDGNQIVGKYIWRGQTHGKITNCRFETTHIMTCLWSSADGSGIAKYYFSDDYSSYKSKSKYSGSPTWTWDAPSNRIAK